MGGMQPIKALLHQRKTGLVHVLTGDGNGKTTSAIGIAVRAAGRGLSVAFVQFLKGGLSSEIPPLEKLGVAVVSGTKHCERQGEHVEQLHEKGFMVFCKGCFAISEEDRKLVRDAFSRASEFCHSGKYDLVVLDEIFWAIKENLVSEEEVVAAIRSRAPTCEIILTGRGSTPAIEEIADYVTYVQKKKHPFDAGIISRCGIDY
jgi:cob(I)alamin adenosyltransferase